MIPLHLGKVLFADEPTSGLDSEMAADMMGALVRSGGVGVGNLHGSGQPG